MAQRYPMVSDEDDACCTGKTETGFFCTRPDGHEGPHVAHNPSGTVIAIDGVPFRHRDERPYPEEDD